MDIDSDRSQDEQPSVPAVVLHASGSAAQHAEGLGPGHWRGRDGGECITLPIGSSLFDVERAFIVATIEHFNGDKRRAASVLGCSVKTLYNKLRVYRQQSVHAAAAACA